MNKKTTGNYNTIIAILFSLLLLGQATNVMAQTIVLKEDHPQQYVVVKGDTLWDIAGRFLQYPWQWPDIWEINPQIKNPHLIYPGDELYLVYVDGQPRIRRKGGRQTFKLSPNKRIEPLNLAIPTIPLEKIAPFFSGNIIVEEGVLERSPYIVGTAEEHLIAAQGYEVYVKNMPEKPQSIYYGIYHKGRIYYDPKTRQPLGREAIYLGEAQLIRNHQPATFRITKSKAEILNGARLIALDDSEFDSNFMPEPAQTSKVGRIIGSLVSGIQAGVNNVAVADVVLVNFGFVDNVKVGDVFNIYNKGKIADDPHIEKARIRLPNKLAGNLLIFRTFEKMSYALIMDAQSVIHKGDLVVSPYMIQKD